ncbi:hypothetical protein E3O42_10420 [Cryobacterium adonitolivorans]|uniref:Arsenate reductase n=1 Tax=Cryobacterium adonitolivorans TaxID=1259189 RepID=A0A4R8W313_9MICO|nr:hypothetical protein [Cryobacterium adonitolivorans]TFC01517.1 hypothetical protein E3O42_10420 [Cryobacterium adonitolivorans]
MTELNWAPTSCTIPTVEQPLREEEFAALFRDALTGIVRSDATTAVFRLHSECKGRARDLAARETSCCSFFTFAFDDRDGELAMTITVPEAQTMVLTALVDAAARAAQLAGA